MADQQRDVIEILTQDHREVEEMFGQLEALRGRTGEEDRARRKNLVDKVTIELVRHAVAEETQVYPAVKEKVSDAEAERAKREHAEAEKTMKELERLDPEDPSFDEQLGTLMREIRTHVAEEEGVMFTHMRQVFTQEELEKLGGRVDAVKKVAPTRPHPMTPNDATVRLAVGPAASLFDRLRDAVSGRGKDG
jgi:hemerythrin superfamily protein